MRQWPRHLLLGDRKGGLHCPATNMEGANLHRKSWNIYTILNNINTKNLPRPLCVHKGELRFDISSYPSCVPWLNFNSHKASKITTQPESVESSAGHPTWWISIFPHPHFLLINILEIQRRTQNLVVVDSAHLAVSPPMALFEHVWYLQLQWWFIVIFPITTTILR